MLFGNAVDKARKHYRQAHAMMRAYAFQVEFLELEQALKTELSPARADDSHVQLVRHEYVVGYPSQFFRCHAIDSLYNIIQIEDASQQHFLIAHPA